MPWERHNMLVVGPRFEEKRDQEANTGEQAPNLYYSTVPQARVMDRFRVYNTCAQHSRTKLHRTGGKSSTVVPSQNKTKTQKNYFSAAMAIAMAACDTKVPLPHQALHEISRRPHVSGLDLLVHVHVPQIQPFRVGSHEALEHRASPLHRTVLKLVLREPATG